VRLLRDLEDPRRRLLVQLLALNALSAVPASKAVAQLFGERPRQLPPGRSFFRLEGDVRVNGAAATLQTPVRPADTVQTGKGAEAAFVVGANAYLLRESSSLQLEQEREDNALINALRLVTGKLLAVFGPSRQRVTTPNTTIGIRGTGVYAESDPEKTYFCTCYGVTDIRAAADPNVRQTVASRHHDQPLYILASAADGKLIRPAPFINHTDQELGMIEALVGRTPPFVFPSQDYGGPRRRY